MTVENLKKLGLLFIAVFAMAAVYDFSNVPPTVHDKNELPFIFSIWGWSVSQELKVGPNFYSDDEILCKGTHCGCEIKIYPNESLYAELDDLLASLPDGFVDSYLPDSAVIWQISRSNAKIYDDKNRMNRNTELWSFENSTNIFYSNSFGDILNKSYSQNTTYGQFKNQEKFFRKDDLNKLSQILKSKSTGIDSTCSEEKIDSIFNNIDFKLVASIRWYSNQPGKW
ncbi:MAG: hypothetical protein R3D86_11390 [Emcibacteraceae bacterium]